MPVPNIWRHYFFKIQCNNYLYGMRYYNDDSKYTGAMCRSFTSTVSYYVRDFCIYKSMEDPGNSHGCRKMIAYSIWNLRPDSSVGKRWWITQDPGEKTGIGRFGAHWSTAPVHFIPAMLDVHLCRSLAAPLLGILSASTPLVTKAASHIQFSFCVRIVLFMCRLDSFIGNIYN